jgi:IclR family acetate operon transcriptional repressor
MPKSLVRERRAAGKAAPGERSSQVQSLLRALSLLNRLAESDEGSGLTELAQKVGLSTSTAHRLLTTLEQERYVQFDGERKLWSVGVQAFFAGSAFIRSRNLVVVARPHMRTLMEDSGETVNLAAEDDGQAIYLAQIECRQVMRAFASPGARVPLTCSGVGKALLSEMADIEVGRILRRTGMARLTDKSLVTPAALREDMALTRRRGYSLDDEEHAVGLRCCASVIFNEFGEPVGAVSVSGPMARITDERLPLLGAMVKATADAVSRQFGGRIPPRRAEDVQMDQQLGGVAST